MGVPSRSSKGLLRRDGSPLCRISRRARDSSGASDEMDILR